MRSRRKIRQRIKTDIVESELQKRKLHTQLFVAFILKTNNLAFGIKKSLFV